MLPRMPVYQESTLSWEMTRDSRLESGENTPGSLSLLTGLLHLMNNDDISLVLELSLGLVISCCTSLNLYDPQHDFTNEFLLKSRCAVSYVTAEFTRLTFTSRWSLELSSLAKIGCADLEPRTCSCLL